MIVVIVLAAFAVMALAAIAGSGRFGQWSEPVNDRPKGFLPDGPVDEDFLRRVRIPTAFHGYHRRQVLEALRLHTKGMLDVGAATFEVTRGGFDMQFVDEVLARPAGAAPAEPDEDAAGGNPAGEPLVVGGHDRLAPSTTEN